MTSNIDHILQHVALQRVARVLRYISPRIELLKKIAHLDQYVLI